jgi:pantoate--beta-alanine ligase
MEVEYYEIVNAATMQPINDWNEAQLAVGCITVYCGEVRLIDNIKYTR